jgi:hypothetical protein
MTRQYSLVKSFGTPWTNKSLPSTVGSRGALFVVTYVDFLQEVLDTDPDRGQGVRGNSPNMVPRLATRMAS